MRIAVIPARGGSKRIPRKNIKNFCGKPMIAWSIKVAILSELFDKIIVSTDDDEIAEVARQCGAIAPFIRPKDISDDYTGTTAVVAHATNWAIKQGYNLDAVCCIYATAPLIQVDDLKSGWEAISNADCDYSFSATDYAAPIFRSFKLTPKGGVEMFFPKEYNTRSQDLPIALHDAGQFYWGRPSAWLEKKCIFGQYSVPIIIPRWRMQDIDNKDDWIRAELLKKSIDMRNTNE